MISDTTFTVRAAAVEELPDLDTFGVFLAEHADGSGRSLDITRALAFDEQDRALGMDTYCLCSDAGPTHYGGIVRYDLSSAWLSIVLDAAAAAALGAREYRLLLAVDPALFPEILSGFQRVMAE